MAAPPGGDDADKTPPSTPTGLTGKVQGSQINLAWNESTDEGGSTLSGYNVYRDGVLQNLFGPFVGPTYGDADVDPGTTYDYEVEAVDGAGNTSEKAPITVTFPVVSGEDTKAPSKPKDFKGAAKGADRVDLSWSPSTDEGGSKLSGYNVFRAGSTKSLNTSLIKGTAYSDLNTESDRTYTYELYAIDGAGNKSGKVTTKVKTPKGSDSDGIDKTKPSAPKDLKAVAQASTQVKLTWQASTDNVAVNNYVVRRAGKDIKTLDGDLLSYTDTGAQPGVTNSYRVVARDAAGNVSSESNQAKAKTPKP